MSAYHFCFLKKPKVGKVHFSIPSCSFEVGWKWLENATAPFEKLRVQNVNLVLKVLQRSTALCRVCCARGRADAEKSSPRRSVCLPLFQRGIYFKYHLKLASLRCRVSKGFADFLHPWRGFFLPFFLLRGCLEEVSEISSSRLLKTGAGRSQVIAARKFHFNPHADSQDNVAEWQMSRLSNFFFFFFFFNLPSHLLGIVQLASRSAAKHWFPP